MDRSSIGHLAVLDAAPNAIVAVDADGRIVYVNRQVALAFGWGEDERWACRSRSSCPSASWASMRNPVARPMGIGLDLAGRRRDGTEFPVEISLSPLETPDGALVFATVVDITARKTAEAQLLQAQKLESIGRLAGGIAHDFNNMLFAIRGYAEMLEEDLALERRGELDPDQALASAEAITNVVERATQLTTQLLAFGRRGMVNPKVLDLNASTAAMEPMLRRLIGEQVSLVLALDPAAGHVRVDAGQLDQIVVNLVVNARDAMPGGGRITIATGNVTFDEPYAMEHYDVQPGSYVMLAVSDNGSGMDRETRRHVFEPFFTTKAPGKGTGLGLATIYGIVRQAGGHIWLYSEPGQGSTFKLYLPRADEAPVELAPVGGSTLRRRGTVLVVEDEPTVRDVTVKVLRRAGWDVVVVPSGMEALTAVDTRAQPFDAVLSDVVMPGMSGIELAGRILDRASGTRIVLLSGYTAETLDLERVIERGVRFVTKPVATRDLMAALEDPVPSTNLTGA
jgi:two-component system, cell cycle sensor histidine kinase and response regulator CckA